MKCDLKVIVAVASYVYMQHTINALPITRKELHFSKTALATHTTCFFFLLIDDR